MVWDKSALKYLLAGFTLLFMSKAYSQEAAPVVVVLPSQSVATSELRLSGTVVALRRAQLSARVEGSVAKVMADAGTLVEQGALLLELDASLQRYELDRLSANVASAQAAVNENQRLVDEALRLTRDNHLPQNELALRKAALATSTALLDAARAGQRAQQQRLDWHRIVAPFKGVVYRKLTETGEWVTPGTPVLELVATDEVYLDVQVPQERYAELMAGAQSAEVSIHSDAAPQRVIPARIAATVPVADAVSRSFRLRLESKESAAGLMPGASATAIFALKNNDATVLTIPRDALLRNPDGGFSVFTVSENSGQLTALRRQVELGRNLGDAIEITSGIKKDEQVVVRGNEILRHNQPVMLADDS